MGFVADLLGGTSSDSADRLKQQAYDLLNSVPLPNAEDMKLKLQGLIVQGTLTPEEAQAYLQERSQLEGIQVDPQLLNTALEELRYLQDVGQSGGMTPTMRARLQQVQDEQEAIAQGKIKGIIEDAHRRGVYGGGLEIGAKLQAEQDAANRASRAGVQAAADAETRALQAIIGAGQLGQGLQSQLFGQEAQAAQAQDVINRFNAQTKQSIENLNVAVRNQAQATNLAEAQRVADANAAAKNAEAINNATIPQTIFQDTLAKRKSQAGVLDDWATEKQRQDELAKRLDLGFWSGLLKAGSTVAAGKAAGDSAPATYDSGITYG